MFELSSAYCLVGRKNANLVLDDPRCSLQHVLLFQGPDSRLWLRDLESTNGTFVMDHRVAERQLTVGDKVRVGKTILHIIEFIPAVEGSLTMAKMRGEDEDEETTVGEKKNLTRPDKKFIKKDENLVNSWPENMLASPKTVQDQFVDYVDEKGERTRIRVKDILKS